DRIDRLDQEIGDAQLDELPRDALAEPRGDDEDGDRSGKPPRQVLQGGYLVGAGGIEIDQKHRGVGERELLLGPAHRAGDDGQIDLRAAAERGAQRLLEIGVGRDRDDPQASGSRCLRTVRHDVPTRFASTGAKPAQGLGAPPLAACGARDGAYLTELVPVPCGGTTLLVRYRSIAPWTSCPLPAILRFAAASGHGSTVSTATFEATALPA